MSDAEAIHEAAEKGNVEQVERLLNQDSTLLEVRGWEGRTPLNLAVMEVEFDVVHLLLIRGADVNSRDERGWTPFQEATYNSTVEMVRLLIQHGADVNTRDNNGRTPLHYAAEDRYADVIALLLENGADGQVRDRMGNTPLDLARRAWGEEDLRGVMALLEGLG